MLKLGQLITLQWTLSAQVKGKSHISLTLNEKLYIVKLTGEGRLKAKTESKWGLSHQLANVNAGRKFP